jgi:UDP-hydrolysing UDP-N-acetyl-D-glucosamine 2-epimerase
MKKQKICVVTGTRAEYGLLYWILKRLEEDPAFDLQIVASGMHLSPEFGLTYKQIEEDGFAINEKIEMLLSSDSSSAVAKSIGLGTIAFSDAFSRLSPNLIILLGDRFEALAAAQTALVLGIPIAHIHGGEVTYGAYDDSIRHSITKMACIHFVTTERHRKRVIQLGENPNRVFNVGAPGVESIMQLPLLTKDELETSLNIRLKDEIFLVTFHPVTLSANPMEGLDELLEAMEEFKETTIIFTKANADHQGREINKKIESFASKNSPSRKVFSSLGQLRYLSLIKASTLVIGNSSSGLLEAPYLETATINIGDRQRGREKPVSVFDCLPNKEAIKQAIEKGLDFEFHLYETKIFGHGHTSEQIVNILKVQRPTLIKEFYDLEV